MNGAEVEHVEGQEVEVAPTMIPTAPESQVALARRWPRVHSEFKRRTLELVSDSRTMAEKCMYVFPRGGKTILGPSIRFFEIVAHTWGNCLFGQSPGYADPQDDRYVLAYGYFRDLETNTLCVRSSKRRITKTDGSRYDDDMIGVTANAAGAIAMRNAIKSGVPEVFWADLFAGVRQVVAGKKETLPNRRAEALKRCQLVGATKEMVLAKLERKGVSDIDLDDIATLVGMLNAIEDGASVESIFGDAEKEWEKSRTQKPAPGVAGVKDALRKPRDKDEASAEQETPERAPDAQEGEPLDAGDSGSGGESADPGSSDVEESEPEPSTAAEVIRLGKQARKASRNSKWYVKEAPPKSGAFYFVAGTGDQVLIQKDGEDVLDPVEAGRMAGFLRVEIARLEA